VHDIRVDSPQRPSKGAQRDEIQAGVYLPAQGVYNGDRTRCRRTPVHRPLTPRLWSRDYLQVEIICESLAKGDNAQLRTAYDQPRNDVNDARSALERGHLFSMANSANASPTVSRRSGR
jgi:predicted amidophosphoribosyltransferase